MKKGVWEKEADMLVTGHCDGSLRIWEISTGKRVYTKSLGSEIVKLYKFDEQSLIVVTSYDTVIYLCPF